MQPNTASQKQPYAAAPTAGIAAAGASAATERRHLWPPVHTARTTTPTGVGRKRFSASTICAAGAPTQTWGVLGQAPAERVYTIHLRPLQALAQTGSEAAKLPNPKYIPKPYAQMTRPGQRGQIDVKFVPAACLVGDAVGQKFYQFTSMPVRLHRRAFPFPLSRGF